MSDVVVRVENLSKKFCRSLKQGVLYTASDISADMMGLRRNADALRPGEFWVTKDLSFELRRGESLGLLGVNGAGKSTLLKMLNGIIRPDKGHIRMKGRIGALIEVGAGFHPMLSGRENIYVNGAILGMSKRAIDRKLDSIIDFSGLDTSILDAPVKTYSSGMYVRLGFAVAIHCEPDILLVDEVLSVGDGAFRVRCAEWLRNYLAADGSLILVSHYLPQMRECCEQVMVLQRGECRYRGDTLQGIQIYQDMLAKQMLSQNAEEKISKNSISFPVYLTSCEILDATTLSPTTELNHEQSFMVRVGVKAERNINGAHLHLTFNGNGTNVCGWTSRANRPSGLNLSVGRHTLTVDLGAVALVPGSYSVSGFLSDNNHLGDYDDVLGPSFTVRTHEIVDSRFGSLMLKGNINVA